MTVLQFLKVVGVQPIQGGSKSLIGKELSIAINSLNQAGKELEEFKGKNLQIIEDVVFSKPTIIATNESVSMTVASDPELITTKNIQAINFTDNVRLYGLTLVDDESSVLYRLTPDSINFTVVF